MASWVWSSPPLFPFGVAMELMELVVFPTVEDVALHSVLYFVFACFVYVIVVALGGFVVLVESHALFLLVAFRRWLRHGATLGLMELASVLPTSEGHRFPWRDAFGLRGG